MTEQVYLSIGSNMGDQLANLNAAVQRLAGQPDITVTAVSSVYETEPWGKRDQANFYNIAVALTTRLDPDSLLTVLHDIEQSLHRQRLVHWGPRTVDLDIIYWGDRDIHTVDLTVPHPHAAERNFVLLPIQEIAGDDTATAQRVAQALAQKTDESWIRKLEGVTIAYD
ncbi:2-amino-4-hydroxy-6-hydroxymethyldihydropteridine pyrophosphokinase [Secundilactobacillus paracollinoides]|uniref:2-amino-4-hydroxy-6-hydroxymethyldihydropteridine diphosphokinase n=1 Tax=Secundilactobacillus paracollinoides TaxID=240427 RepID=A0A1B2IWF9_9LACO|nr:2-amino-4-hydroxy-6-hydroxymethyldihydropteridine diphosphokinase [Secundilactobacillus paracollinoides]ANZ60545.1 2-amino-4-hydroxy-6-hydroxymethyldihydropteridine pyrophosphokinase [Secundilactobacillus paracollinoides]ANZ64858.1 2-amino-4-hydroxy-6-hydroxymethyldihydropteridine pyrophosphokinase [Secundilactobacillus paracollinoides]ANZ66372.1 2-amino-4-hydroxy-6-hydroxymethyldihydropteridine pyrophosphokinase [Secundilactobacillus paracollinoides]KRL79656.1 2-amino-4-hydroxy-6-hydroxymet